jgi:hypothetical protein
MFSPSILTDHLESLAKSIDLFVLFHLDPPAFPVPAIYSPIHCGYMGDLNDYPYLTDRTDGEFLSTKADYYSELSGIYWAWKNSKSNILGSCHYRRVFTTYPFSLIYRLKRLLNSRLNVKLNLAPRRNIPSKKIGKFLPYLLNEQTILETFKNHDAILPAPLILKVTVREHYRQHHQIADLDLLEKIIQEKYAEYSDAFSEIMDSHELYPYNMFVLNREVFDQFMPWWFGVLGDFENRIDLAQFTGYQKRILGYLSERLLTVWFKKNNQIRIKEFPLLFFKKLKID